MKRIFLATFLSAAAAASVLVQGAMPSEVAVLKAACEDAKTEKIQAYEFSKCQIKGQDVIIAKTLVGEINAAISTTLALQKWPEISLVINQGTAGAHRRDLHRGDVIIGEKIYNFAAYLTPRTAEHALQNREKMRAPLRLGDEGAVDAPSFYASDEAAIAAAQAAASELKISAQRGTIVSSDAFNREAQMIDYTAREYGSSAEEMEAIAAAQAAAAWGVPYLALRVVSNNELLGEDFDEQTAKISQNVVIKMLENMSK